MTAATTAWSLVRLAKVLSELGSTEGAPTGSGGTVVDVVVVVSPARLVVVSAVSSPFSSDTTTSVPESTWSASSGATRRLIVATRCVPLMACSVRAVPTYPL